jgi:hypothetical protein
LFVLFGGLVYMILTFRVIVNYFLPKKNSPNRAYQLGEGK